MVYMLISYIRRLIYRLGFRPRAGSLFFSPSLSFFYAFKDNPTWFSDIVEDFNDGNN